MIRCIIGCIEILSCVAFVRAGIDVTEGECSLNLSTGVSEGTYSMSEFRESRNTCCQYHGEKCHLVISLLLSKTLFLAFEIEIPRFYYTQI